MFLPFYNFLLLLFLNIGRVWSRVGFDYRISNIYEPMVTDCLIINDFYDGYIEVIAYNSSMINRTSIATNST